jgi:hypothetical protein
MDNLTKVFWKWDQGSVTTELLFSNEAEKKFYLSEPPPTTPAHDIAHFICGFHPNMEWDFSVEPNHIAEYNAVFIEHLLIVFYSYPELDDENFKIQIDGVYEYMRWFSEDYYRIQESLGEKYTSEYLRKNFLEKIDPLIVSKFYKEFYMASYLVEELKLLQNTINIQLTLDEKTATIDQDCYEFMVRVKSLGN